MEHHQPEATRVPTIPSIHPRTLRHLRQLHNQHSVPIRQIGKPQSRDVNLILSVHILPHFAIITFGKLIASVF